MAKPDAPATVSRPVVAFPVSGNTVRKPQPVTEEQQDNSAFNDYMEKCISAAVNEEKRRSCRTVS